jgi:hypothetical protein
MTASPSTLPSAQGSDEGQGPSPPIGWGEDVCVGDDVCVGVDEVGVCDALADLVAAGLFEGLGVELFVRLGDAVDDVGEIELGSEDDGDGLAVGLDGLATP